MSRRRKLLTGLAAAVLVLTAWVFRPYTTGDPDQIHPEIASLTPPFDPVYTAYWMDGGSLGISITDSRGEELEACIPQPDRNRLYLGAWHYTRDGAYEVKDPGESIDRLLSIVRNYEKPDRQNDLVVSYGSGRLRDILRILLRNFRGMYPEQVAIKPGESDW